MFGGKKDKEEKSKSSAVQPKSPSILRQGGDAAKIDKWKQEQQKKTEKMAKNALEEEEDTSVLPLAVRQLEFCPAPTRRHTQFLLSGYLAVKTSGGWTRKWQTRFCVLTPTALYVYKRPPPTTEDTFAQGPQVNAVQASSVVNSTNLEKEKSLTVDNDTITYQRLAKVLSTADTTEDGSHELFGLIRDSIPIESSTIIMEVPQLPNTFCLTFPECPRLLLRAANYEQFKLWMYTIQSTILLRTCPPHTINAQLARTTPKDEINNLVHLIPHVEEIFPLFTERAAVINSLTLHPTNQSVYTDVALANTDQTATNVPLATTATAVASPPAATSPHPVSKEIVNSNQINAGLIHNAHVNLNGAPSQGSVITNLTPWGQKINIVLNQLQPNHPTAGASSMSPTPHQILDIATKDQSVTITMGDGGFITLPIDNLYQLYQQHMSQLNERSSTLTTTTTTTTSPQPQLDITASSPGLLDGDVKLSSTYADALFGVSNSFYNADFHVAFRFSAMPASRKDPAVGTKAKKLSAKQQAQLRQHQEEAMQALRDNATPPIHTFMGALALGFSAFIVYSLHNILPHETPSDIATVWIIYAVLASFCIKMANVTFKASQRRESLGQDRDAITKIVSLSGFQQVQLAAAMTTAGADSSTSAATAPANVPVLELIPIRIVDRHTITGAVLLGGCKFDHNTFPPLPIRTTYSPQISLIKALHSSQSLDTQKGSNPLGKIDALSLDSDDEDGKQAPSATADSDDDEVFETDPVLGKVFVECWGKWCQSDYRGLQLRGPDYLTDKKKPKIPALPHRFQSCHTGIYELKESKPHCARWVNSYYRKQRQKAIELGKGDWWVAGTPLKYLVVNMLVPGTPNYNFVMYFRNPYIYPSPYPDDIARGHQQEFHPTSPDKPAVVYPNQIEGKPDPLARLIEDFCNGDDAYRKARFKYIPSVAQGAWLVKRTVGQTPVILGNKLTQFYFKDPHGQYMEVDVDVSSSSVAGSILGVVKGYAKSLAIDLNFLLEPHSPDELPEALWGGCRIINIDLYNVEHIDPVAGPADD